MPRLKPNRGTLIRTSHPLTRDLTGCWLLNEGTGQTVADLGPYHQYGNFYGGPPLWKPGRHGYCFRWRPAFCRESTMTPLQRSDRWRRSEARRLSTPLAPPGAAAALAIASAPATVAQVVAAQPFS